MDDISAYFDTETQRRHVQAGLPLERCDLRDKASLSTFKGPYSGPVKAANTEAAHVCDLGVGWEVRIYGSEHDMIELYAEGRYMWHDELERRTNRNGLTCADIAHLPGWPAFGVVYGDNRDLVKVFMTRTSGGGLPDLAPVAHFEAFYRTGGLPVILEAVETGGFHFKMTYGRNRDLVWWIWWWGGQWKSASG